MKNTGQNLFLILIIGLVLCCISMITISYVISEENTYRSYVIAVPFGLFTVLAIYIKNKAKQLRHKEKNENKF